MTTTTNYQITLPVVGSDEDQWGTKINTAFQAVDDLLGGDTPVTSIDINSGNIDGAAIGANNPQSGAFTTISASGLITGDIKGDVQSSGGQTVLNNGTNGTDATSSGSSARLTNARAFSVSGDVATSSGVNFDGTGAVDLPVSITDTLWDKIYPEGSIYATTKTDFNPNASFYGTWVEYAAGKVLVGYDENDTDFDTVNSATHSGAKTHQLTEAELPSHNHSYTVKTGRSYGSSTGNADNGVVQGSDGVQFDSETQTTANTGSNTAHNNLQPYIVVKYWRRTA